jgi:hypothetical protein
MTAVAPKAALVTAFESQGTSAATFASPLTFGGRVRSIVSVTSVAAADSDLDIFHVTPVYSSWRIDRILSKNTAITAGTAYECGLYQTSLFSTAVVDIDVYAATQTFAVAIATLPLDLVEQVRALTTSAQAVWQDAAATADTRRWYYLSYTATTAGTAAGTISTRVHYVDGGS